MDDEIKREFEHLNTRISELRTDLSDRFRNLIRILGYALVLGGIIFSLVSLIFSRSFSDEKADLREFKKNLQIEINRELGNIGEPPKLELYNWDNEKLRNSTVITSADQCKGSKTCITVGLIIKNVGETNSGEIYLKWYFDFPFFPVEKSSDEPDYNYENATPPEKHSLGKLPGGGYSTTYTMTHIMDFPKEIWVDGEYAALIKVYYGEGLQERVEYKINTQK